MGRIGSFGRGGRAGSSMPRRPKYLSLPPPILQFRPQPLTPESTVCSVIDEEIAFETSDYISNSAPPLFSTKDDNGWITIPNRPNTPRSIYLDNLTVTDSPTKLQRLSPKYTKTSSPIWNSGKSSHNSQNSPRSTNQFSLLSDNMEDTTTTSTPSSAPDNTVSTPVTPPGSALGVKLDPLRHRLLQKRKLELQKRRRLKKRQLLQILNQTTSI